jgi:hypothetical protein
MTAERKVWCVAWRDLLTDRMEWCATFRGHKPSIEATSDKTACGYFVTLAIGKAKRLPTCPYCRERVARRRT